VFRHELGAQPNETGVVVPAGDRSVPRVRAAWAAGESVGERLLAYRRERGLCQAALARLLGVDPGTLSRWERGLRVPTGKHARLAERFLSA
jgi:ribosome-binding protein aMBF1 (putative translation factor)